MHFWWPLLPVSLVVLILFKGANGKLETYNAVVVEYNPPINTSLAPQTNFLNNVRTYVEYIKLANSEFLADIIVFPEMGLRGYFNGKVYLEIPDPADKVVPCAHNTTYEAPLIQISCAARATATYVVINLGEKFYDKTLGSTVYFNTDVVFDRSGSIIARYRKIHLFGEAGKTPSLDKGLVYFDTDFGVRFGVFTCFDIIFEIPSLYLARLYNVTHFVFPTAWFSELPFLTAIQEQAYWSYTLDAVLLAAGYNEPSVGSSGTGVYLGRQGPLTYSLSQVAGSFMLYAQVPKDLHSGFTSMSSIITRSIPLDEQSCRKGLKNDEEKIILKRDYLDVYTTVPITMPENAPLVLNGSTLNVPFVVEETVCQNTLCCHFSVKVMLVFSNRKPDITRGDDYSQLYYRLATFDGVRTYDSYATGGIQACAIIPCINSDLSSCGLSSDTGSAKPNVFLDSFQTDFIFESITIRGNFSNNNSFVGPNVLLEGKNDLYGSLLPSNSFVFSRVSDVNISENTFQTIIPISNLVTASLYGRVFSRDEEGYTDESSGSVLTEYGVHFNVMLIVSQLSIVINFILY